MRVNKLVPMAVATQVLSLLTTVKTEIASATDTASAPTLENEQSNWVPKNAVDMGKTISGEEYLKDFESKLKAEKAQKRQARYKL